TLARAGPALHLFTLVVVPYECPWPGAVVMTFCVPAGDEGIKNDVAHGEKELHVAVRIVPVPPGNRLGERQPVPGLPGGLGAVAHEFHDGFLLHREAGVKGNALVHFLLQLLRADFRGWSRTKLIAPLEREGLDTIPVRREETQDNLAALAIVKGN